MTDFPESARETRALADKLVTHLKGGIKNTKGSAKIWTDQNLDLLDKFCRYEVEGIDPTYHGRENGPECLWDFVGYVKEKGILITAESEHNTHRDEIAKDFDKLLYGSSPIKLMICRIDTKYKNLSTATEEAERIRVRLGADIKGSCVHYPPASVFIIYCVWWAEEGGPNRDFPYILQIDGEPTYSPARDDQQFEPVP